MTDTASPSTCAGSAARELGPGTGRLVLFDNRVTRHYAPDDYDDLPRLLHRVTAAGDVPVGVDGRHSYAPEGDGATHCTPAVAA